MLIVHVDVQVKPDQVEAFMVATADNCRHSSQEPGIVRFELIQDESDPARFVLVEIYRTVADTVKHKETAHYARWRDAVAPMMATARIARKFRDIHPQLV